MKNKIGLEKGFVRLEKYNSEWQEEFNKEKKNLKKIFGDVAISIEHIGSTAVLGASAKPIIDIAIGVSSLEDLAKVKEKILKYPYYSIKEDGAHGEILVRRGVPIRQGEYKPSFVTHFIHIMEIDERKYKETIAYRDYLRKNKKALREYNDLKHKLAIKYENDRKAYSKAKDEFIKNVLNKIKIELPR